MLPIFKKKNEGPASTGLLIKHRAPDEKPESSDEESSSKEACGRDIINAIKNDDPKALAEALCDLFYIADSEPHEEGEHPSPHSYDAQNIKAGEQE